MCAATTHPLNRDAIVQQQLIKQLRGSRPRDDDDTDRERLLLLLLKVPRSRKICVIRKTCE